ncbi:MAG TPA: TIGR01777 family oxidoreductase [Bryobacteraceae bacterium]|nr:TIGR01777 family oxidoreductase [Bryobacteraceae bacterium]
MTVAITGATGFIGKCLMKNLGAGARAVSLRGSLDGIAGADAVVHLAGEPVSQRWTEEVREKIRSSRVEGTRRVVDAMRAKPPRVLASASAVGYYGSRGDEILTEASAPASGFLADVCLDWEREARKAEEFGVRVVCVRLGLALGDGGGLEKMLVPFKLGIGGKIGDGKQWMAWIHVDDAAGLIEFALNTPSLRGPVNATAPNPATNAEFTRALASALHRPAIFPVPKFALHLLYGEMARIVYASQRVIPEAALAAGYKFRYPTVDGALRAILG